MNVQASQQGSGNPPSNAQKQVITISETGEIQSLRRKKGEGIDLRQLGHAEIERVSEIIFSNQEQKFYVHFLVGALASRCLTYALYSAATGKATRFKAGKPIMLFEEYEDAVRAEVEVLDAIRASGFSPSQTELDKLSSVVG